MAKMTTLVSKGRHYILGLAQKKGFFRNVAVLAGGTALGHTIALLASPILTRLFPPEAFGELSVFVSILSILAVVVALRYELAIPLAEDDKVAANLLFLSLLIVLGTSLLLGLLVWFLGDRIVDYMNVQSLRPYLWLLPVGLLALGMTTVFNYWVLRKEAFPAIARAKLSNSLSLVLTQVSLGLLGLGSLALIVGYVIGQIVGGGTLIFSTRPITRESVRAVSPANLRQAGKRYRRFPLFSSWSAVLNALSRQIPLLILASLFGPTIAGLYAFANRLLQTPMSLIGLSIAQVFYSGAAEANRQGKIASLTESVFRRLLQIGMPVLLLVGLSAPEVFAFVFGEEWRQAGVYAQWLALWLLLVFVSSPLSTLPSILEKQGQELAFQVTLLVCRIVALGIGGWLQDANLAIGLFALVSAVCWFGFMLWNMRLSGNGVRKVLGLIAYEGVIALLFVTPILLVKIIFRGSPDDLYIVIAAALSGLLIAYRLFKILGREASV
jgi:O-antigen/teichoic acid export membrane protein